MRQLLNRLAASTTKIRFMLLGAALASVGMGFGLVALMMGGGHQVALKTGAAVTTTLAPSTTSADTTTTLAGSTPTTVATSPTTTASGSTATTVPVTVAPSTATTVFSPPPTTIASGPPPVMYDVSGTCVADESRSTGNFQVTCNLSVSASNGSVPQGSISADINHDYCNLYEHGPLTNGSGQLVFNYCNGSSPLGANAAAQYFPSSGGLMGQGGSASIPVTEGPNTN